jgi:MYXO-CTERM domain-containing protein
LQLARFEAGASASFTRILRRMRTFRAVLSYAAVATALTLALLTLAPKAQAFCGFYVSGADNKLFADATQVVLMRDGMRTVLSMQNDYKGPPEKFALVIPVPVILAKENVKVLPREVFDKVDKLGAPRLVEYWEQDPCPSDSLGLSGIGEGGGGFGSGIGLGSVGGLGRGTDLGVKVEAKFDVGEYEVVVLSAKDASGLDTWLKQEQYAIPDGAEPYFKPYIASGMKFFVAKVDITKVKFDAGRATLSPLRFHYDSDKFALPVRLGLINSSGKQDLIVNIVAKNQRYEVANYPNAFIPTNLDVAEGARGQFGSFYAALFDKVLEKSPKAVVTEYSWDAGTCDPCPGPTLDGNDLATLGADVLPNGTDGLRNSGGGGSSTSVVRQGTVNVQGKLPPEVIQRIVRQRFPQIRQCYDVARRANPNLAGTFEVKASIDATGAVTKASAGAGTMTDPAAQGCIVRAFKALSFPQPESGTVEVSFGLTLSSNGPPSTASQSGLGLSGIGGGGFGGRMGAMGFSTPYVLTRLHLRYDRASLGEDLVFRAAPAMVGGREVRGNNRALEQGASPSSTNNFQGRYAIRHPWKGAITCKEPRRGVWGGPPAGSAQPGPVAGQKLAFVRRDAPLGSFLTSALPELAVQPVAPIASATATEAPAASASAQPVPIGSVSAVADAAAAAPKAPVVEKKGCNAGTGATGDTTTTGAALLALAMIVARRRRVS